MKKAHITDDIKKIFRFNTLTSNIIVSFIFIIILSTSMISIIYYYKSLNFINQQNNMYANNLCRNITNSIDQYIQEMDRTSKILLGNSTIQHILLNSQQANYSDIQRVNDLHEIDLLVLSFTSIRDRMTIGFYNQHGTVFYLPTGKFSNYDHNLFDNRWMKEHKSQIDSRTIFLIPSYNTSMRLVDGRKVLSLIRCLKKLDSDAVVAYITVSSDLDALLPILKSSQLFNKETSIQIVDDTGIIVLDLNVENIGKQYIQPNKGQIEIKSKSSVTGWTSIIKLPVSYINKGLEEARIFSILISIMVIILAMALAIIVSSYILKPIKYLTREMTKVEGGNFDIILEENVSNYDIKKLYQGFNRMISEIKKLIQNIYVEKLLVKSSQLEALQFQINPHFLYNTLQTMEAIGEVKGIPEIQIIAKSLGDLFRYNIRGKNIVYLEDEINQINKYFAIEKIRFREKIEVNFSIDENIKKSKILKFILQPIIENSINHGFRNLKRKIVINIEAIKSQNELKIYIGDNGIGIIDTKLEDIKNRLTKISESSSMESCDFIGILNVHKRLVNYYGHPYGLKIESQEHQGTMVIISLPFLQDE